MSVIKSSYEAGATLLQLSKEFSISISTVKKELHEAGVPYEELFNDLPWMIEAIELYKQGKNYSQIARELGYTSTSVRSMLTERGIAKTRFFNLTKDQIHKIKELYNQGLTTRQVAAIIGVTKTTVQEYIPKELVKKKAFYNKYTCNYSFFENIDNEVKAYFLGLFYADGCNLEKTKCVHIGFAEKDKELLYKFVEAIESNHRIDVRNRSLGNSQDFYRVTINSPILSADLAKHGCVSAKTHVLDKMPDMSEELYRHFIRGYFDGDGSVYYTQSGNVDKITLSWTGNKPFLEDVQAYLIKELEVSKTAIYITHPDRNNLIGDLRYSNGTATKIHSWMYSDCQYYSERKKMIPVLRPQVHEEKGKEYARNVMDEFYSKINQNQLKTCDERTENLCVTSDSCQRTGS